MAAMTPLESTGAGAPGDKGDGDGEGATAWKVVASALTDTGSTCTCRPMAAPTASATARDALLVCCTTDS